MTEGFELNRQFEGLFDNQRRLARLIYEQLASKLNDNNQESFEITIGDKKRFRVEKDSDPSGSNDSIHIQNIEVEEGESYIYLLWPNGDVAKVSATDPEEPLELEEGELETILGSLGSLADQEKSA